MFFLFSQPRVLRKVCHNKHCRLHHGHTRDHTLTVSAPAGSRGITSRVVLPDAVVESRHASSDGCYTWHDDARDARHRHHEHDRHLYQGFLHHRPGTGIKGVRTNALIIRRRTEPCSRNLRDTWGQSSSRQKADPESLGTTSGVPFLGL